MANAAFPVQSAIAVLPLLLAACGGPAPQAGKPASYVRTQTASIVDYAPDLVVSGEVSARNEVPLSFQAGGQLVEVRVEVGAHVDPGDILARLEPRTQQALVAAAQAGVLAAEAQVTQVNADFTRQQSLFDQGLVTRSQFEQAQTAAETAGNALAIAKAQVATAQQSLDQTVLKASVPGTITERDLSNGEIAQAGQTVLVLAEDGPRDAVFNVQEAVFLARPPGDGVTIGLVDNPAITARGALRSVSPTLDPKTGTVQVTVSLQDATGDMPLGSAVAATTKAKAIKATVIPWSALWSDGGKPAVWIVSAADQSVSLTPVQVMAYTTDSVVLSGGLAAGSVFVVEGGKLLHPGQIVTNAPEVSK